MQVIDKDICFKLKNETTNIKDAITPGVTDLLDIFAINWSFVGQISVRIQKGEYPDIWV